MLFWQNNSNNLQRKHKKSLCSRELHIFGLIRELKHSNSNARHCCLISKGSLFSGTPLCIYKHKNVDGSGMLSRDVNHEAEGSQKEKC